MTQRQHQLDDKRARQRTLQRRRNRRALAATGISQRELAIAAAVSPSMISRTLDGLRTPSLPVAIRIAATLGIAVDDLS